jgi:hypothetical protein
MTAMKREEELTVSEQLAEALDHIKRLIVALKPFSDFAINVEFDGDLNTNAWKSRIHRESISTWFGPSDFAYAAFAVGDTSDRLSAISASPKPEAEPIGQVRQLTDGYGTRPIWFGETPPDGTMLYAHPPNPEPVGWETDAEWELEMRCANITENTPFDEVSKLINDLWQQYCLAAEPKGVAHQVHHSKPVVSQNTQIVEDNAFRALVERAQAIISTSIYPSWHEAARAALTAKQTDGREEE